MKRVRYTKHDGSLADEMSMEDLLNALSDFLLDSGFQNPWTQFQDLDQTMEALREALRQALESGELFNEQMQQKIDELAAQNKLDELIDQIIQRMEQENYISVEQPRESMQTPSSTGQIGENESQARFEVTDKSLDFLGYKTLRDLLGSLASRVLDAMTRATG